MADVFEGGELQSELLNTYKQVGAARAREA